MSDPNSAKVRLWSASDSAFSGDGCTSMSSPWAPTALAAQANANLLLARLYVDGRVKRSYRQGQARLDG